MINAKSRPKPLYYDHMTYDYPHIVLEKETNNLIPALKHAAKPLQAKNSETKKKNNANKLNDW